MVRWNTYKKNALQAAFEVSDVQGYKENREILTRLIDITLYLARQGKAFRGDDESATSSNQGNFLQLVQMFSQYDSVLAGYIWIMSMTRKWNCNIDLSTAYAVVDGVMDTLSNLRTEEQFGKLFKSATEKAEAAGISIPTVSPGQQRQRRVPAKYWQSTNAATESHSFQSVEDYYRGKVYYSFIDVLSQELKRRFRGDGETESSKILNALHTLTKANNWIGKDAMGPDSLDAVHMLCEFCGGEEQKLKTELRVLHASFPNTCTMKGIFKTLRDNSGQNIFPTLVEMIRTYATIPVSTATVERSFSKLKLVKDTLRSQCTEERLSDLLLLAIEKDIPVIHSEVINIYRDMAPRRWLL
ncbi:hypothetical protein JOQ06_009883 [Pogonophryne albipinna]|uniref:HAT C-terminal dimerisation domain-containing protein n=1 Tax=Pogonophryne albipinna TaxID=1090488 RepID=A0AAD6FUP6_9TELE|nr:hypothetical protein JOQ06_009883 [Pogonophryne albipinna]